MKLSNDRMSRMSHLCLPFKMPPTGTSCPKLESSELLWKPEHVACGCGPVRPLRPNRATPELCDDLEIFLTGNVEELSFR